MLEKSMAPPLPQRPSPAGPSGLRSPSTATLGDAAPVSPFGPRLSAQHERLMLELLPFKDAAQFREWLGFIEGDWAEYCRDYLEPLYAAVSDNNVDNVLDDPEPDKATTASRAKDAINNQSVQFLAYHRLAEDKVKENWSAEDHAVRFMVTAIADSLLRKVWQERDWRKRPVEIARAVYEVLSYKRAGYAEYQQQLWVQRQRGNNGSGSSTGELSPAGQERQRQHHLPARRGPSTNLMDSPPEYDY